ncbi:MAG: peptidoglycan-binding protein [Oscillospiraceae bacterium]|nr:peptidoglycan-binding protein [Oscillospiraceae bacterium]
MTDIQTIYSILRQGGLTETGALAMMGNWHCESLLDPFRKQGDLSQAALPSHQYVAQVTSGQIAKMTFAQDQIGFGLAQWTFWDFSGGREGRKLDLYNFWKASGQALDSAAMQTRFALWELTNKGQYAKLLNYLRTVGPDGLYNACDRVCREYEQPAFNNVQNRYDAAVQLAARLDLNDAGVPAGSGTSGKPETVSDPDTGSSGQPAAPKEPDKPTTPFWPVRGARGGGGDPGLCKGMIGCDVMYLQAGLTCRGHACTIDGIFGSDTDAALKAHQTEQGLTPDGICGPMTWQTLRPV